MSKQNEETDQFYPPKCPICGAFLTATTEINCYDFGGQEDVNYYCKKCQAAGR
jgi:hypothetical protein